MKDEKFIKTLTASENPKKLPSYKFRPFRNHYFINNERVEIFIFEEALKDDEQQYYAFIQARRRGNLGKTLCQLSSFATLGGLLVRSRRNHSA